MANEKFKSIQIVACGALEQIQQILLKIKISYYKKPPEFKFIGMC